LYHVLKAGYEVRCLSYRRFGKNIDLKAIFDGCFCPFSSRVLD